MTDCERVLKILKDGKPHMNFDIMNMLGGGFAVAARIWDLRKIDGKYRLNIKYGSPKEFGKVRQSEGEWWYQLIKPELYDRPSSVITTHLFGVSPIMYQEKPEKPLTKEFMETHRQALDRILA